MMRKEPKRTLRTKKNYEKDIKKNILSNYRLNSILTTSTRVLNVMASTQTAKKKKNESKESGLRKIDESKRKKERKMSAGNSKGRANTPRVSKTGKYG